MMYVHRLQMKGMCITQGVQGVQQDDRIETAGQPKRQACTLTNMTGKAVRHPSHDVMTWRAFP